MSKIILLDVCDCGYFKIIENDNELIEALINDRLYEVEEKKLKNFLKGENEYEKVTSYNG